MEIIGILAIKCIKTVFRQKSKRNFMFLSSAIVCGCLMLMRFGSGDRLYSYLTSDPYSNLALDVKCEPSMKGSFFSQCAPFDVGTAAEGGGGGGAGSGNQPSLTKMLLGMLQSSSEDEGSGIATAANISSAPAPAPAPAPALTMHRKLAHRKRKGHAQGHGSAATPAVVPNPVSTIAASEMKVNNIKQTGELLSNMILNGIPLLDIPDFFHLSDALNRQLGRLDDLNSGGKEEAVRDDMSGATTDSSGNAVGGGIDGISAGATRTFKLLNANNTHGDKEGSGNQPTAPGDEADGGSGSTGFWLFDSTKSSSAPTTSPGTTAASVLVSSKPRGEDDGGVGVLYQPRFENVLNARSLEVRLVPDNCYTRAFKAYLESIIPARPLVSSPHGGVQVHGNSSHNHSTATSHQKRRLNSDSDSNSSSNSNNKGDYGETGESRRRKLLETDKDLGGKSPHHDGPTVSGPDGRASGPRLSSRHSTLRPHLRKSSGDTGKEQNSKEHSNNSDKKGTAGTDGTSTSVRIKIFPTMSAALRDCCEDVWTIIEMMPGKGAEGKFPSGGGSGSNGAVHLGEGTGISPEKAWESAAIDVARGNKSDVSKAHQAVLDPKTVNPFSAPFMATGGGNMAFARCNEKLFRGIGEQHKSGRSHDASANSTNRTSSAHQQTGDIPHVVIRMRPATVPDTRNFKWSAKRYIPPRGESTQILYILSGFLSFQIEVQNFLATVGVAPSTGHIDEAARSEIVKTPAELHEALESRLIRTDVFHSKALTKTAELYETMYKLTNLLMTMHSGSTSGANNSSSTGGGEGSGGVGSNATNSSASNGAMQGAHNQAVFAELHEILTKDIPHRRQTVQVPVFHRAFPTKAIRQGAFWHSFGDMITIAFIIIMSLPAAIIGGEYRKEVMNGHADVLSTLVGVHHIHNVLAWLLCGMLCVVIMAVPCFFAFWYMLGHTSPWLPTANIILYGLAQTPIALILGTCVRLPELTVISVPIASFMMLLPGLLYYNLAFDVQRNWSSNFFLDLLPSSAVGMVLKLVCSTEASAATSDPLSTNHGLSWVSVADVSDTPLYLHTSVLLWDWVFYSVVVCVVLHNLHMRRGHKEHRYLSSLAGFPLSMESLNESVSGRNRRSSTASRTSSVGERLYIAENPVTFCLISIVSCCIGSFYCVLEVGQCITNKISGLFWRQENAPYVRIPGGSDYSLPQYGSFDDENGMSTPPLSPTPGIHSGSASQVGDSSSPATSFKGSPSPSKRSGTGRVVEEECSFDVDPELHSSSTKKKKVTPVRGRVGRSETLDLDGIRPFDLSNTEVEGNDNCPTRVQRSGSSVSLTDTSTPLLRIAGLCKHYLSTSKGSAVQILSNINTQLNYNTVTCLLGSNGAGKSTMLRILAGLDDEYDGEVSLRTRRVQSYITSRRKHRRTDSDVDDSSSVTSLANPGCFCGSIGACCCCAPASSLHDVDLLDDNFDKFDPDGNAWENADNENGDDDDESSLLRGPSGGNSLRNRCRQIGWCAQQDVLFEELTVYENLQLFYELQYANTAGSSSTGNTWTYFNFVLVIKELISRLVAAVTTVFYIVCGLEMGSTSTTCPDATRSSDGLPATLAEQVHAQIMQDLNEVALHSHMNKTIAALSGGMKRRLCFLVAFTGSPRCVFLDEPTSGCDSYTRELIRKQILKRKNRCTILISTHHLDDVEVLSDNIWFLNEQHLVYDGSVQELVAKGNENLNYFEFDHFHSNDDNNAAASSGLKIPSKIAEVPGEDISYQDNAVSKPTTSAGPSASASFISPEKDDDVEEPLVPDSPMLRSPSGFAAALTPFQYLRSNWLQRTSAEPAASGETPPKKPRSSCASSSSTTPEGIASSDQSHATRVKRLDSLEIDSDSDAEDIFRNNGTSSQKWTVSPYRAGVPSTGASPRSSFRGRSRSGSGSAFNAETESTILEFITWNPAVISAFHGHFGKDSSYPWRTVRDSLYEEAALIRGISNAGSWGTILEKTSSNSSASSSYANLSSSNSSSLNSFNTSFSNGDRNSNSNSSNNLTSGSKPAMGEVEVSWNVPHSKFGSLWKFIRKLEELEHRGADVIAPDEGNRNANSKPQSTPGNRSTDASLSSASPAKLSVYGCWSLRSPSIYKSINKLFLSSNASSSGLRKRVSCGGFSHSSSFASVDSSDDGTGGSGLRSSRIRPGSSKRRRGKVRFKEPDAECGGGDSNESSTHSTPVGASSNVGDTMLFNKREGGGGATESSGLLRSSSDNEVTNERNYGSAEGTSSRPSHGNSYDGSRSFDGVEGVSSNRSHSGSRLYSIFSVTMANAQTKLLRWCRNSQIKRSIGQKLVDIGGFVNQFFVQCFVLMRIRALEIASYKNMTQFMFLQWIFPFFAIYTVVICCQDIHYPSTEICSGVDIGGAFHTEGEAAAHRLRRNTQAAADNLHWTSTAAKISSVQTRQGLGEMLISDDSGIKRLHSAVSVGTSDAIDFCPFVQPEEGEGVMESDKYCPLFSPILNSAQVDHIDLFPMDLSNSTDAGDDDSSSSNVQLVSQLSMNSERMMDILSRQYYAHRLGTNFSLEAGGETGHHRHHHDRHRHHNRHLRDRNISKSKGTDEVLSVTEPSTTSKGDSERWGAFVINDHLPTFMHSTVYLAADALQISVLELFVRLMEMQTDICSELPTSPQSWSNISNATSDWLDFDAAVNDTYTSEADEEVAARRRSSIKHKWLHEAKATGQLIHSEMRNDGKRILQQESYIVHSLGFCDDDSMREAQSGSSSSDDDNSDDTLDYNEEVYPVADTVDADAAARALSADTTASGSRRSSLRKTSLLPKDRSSAIQINLVRNVTKIRLVVHNKQEVDAKVDRANGSVSEHDSNGDDLLVFNATTFSISITCYTALLAEVTMLTNLTNYHAIPMFLKETVPYLLNLSRKRSAQLNHKGTKISHRSAKSGTDAGNNRRRTLLHRPSNEAKDGSSLSPDAEDSFPVFHLYNHPLPEANFATPAYLERGYLGSILIALYMFIATSSCVRSVVANRYVDIKTQYHLVGVPCATYWLANYVFDVLVLLSTIGTILLAIYLGGSPVDKYYFGGVMNNADQGVLNFLLCQYAEWTGHEHDSLGCGYSYTAGSSTNSNSSSNNGSGSGGGLLVLVVCFTFVCSCVAANYFCCVFSSDSLSSQLFVLVSSVLGGLFLNLYLARQTGAFYDWISAVFTTFSPCFAFASCLCDLFKLHTTAIVETMSHSSRSGDGGGGSRLMMAYYAHRSHRLRSSIEHNVAVLAVQALIYLILVIALDFYYSRLKRFYYDFAAFVARMKSRCFGQRRMVTGSTPMVELAPNPSGSNSVSYQNPPQESSVASASGANNKPFVHISHAKVVYNSHRGQCKDILKCDEESEADTKEKISGEMVALNDVSLSFKAGERVAVIGVNGGGKSTLFKTMTSSFNEATYKSTVKGGSGRGSGVSLPYYYDDEVESSAGRGSEGARGHRRRHISMNGGDIISTQWSHISRYGYLGYVPQERGVLEYLTVQDSLAMFTMLNDCNYGKQQLCFQRRELLNLRNATQQQIANSNAAKKAAHVALTSILTSKYSDYPVSTLSGGNKKKLSIILSNIHAPACLLLDEVTSGVDPVAAEHIVNILQSHLAPYQGLIFSSHRIDECIATCSRAVILCQGKVYFDGPMSDFSKLTSQYYQIDLILKPHAEKFQENSYADAVLDFINATLASVSSESSGAGTEASSSTSSSSAASSSASARAKATPKRRIPTGRAVSVFERTIIYSPTLIKLVGHRNKVPISRLWRILQQLKGKRVSGEREILLELRPGCVGGNYRSERSTQPSKPRQESTTVSIERYLFRDMSVEDVLACIIARATA